MWKESEDGCKGSEEESEEGSERSEEVLEEGCEGSEGSGNSQKRVVSDQRSVGKSQKRL